MSIRYEQDIMPSTEMIIELYHASGLERPLNDKKRIAKMFAHSNLVLTAWHEEKLVGICRSLTDFCYCCYVSDLAVRNEYQRQGIGKDLIRRTKIIAGEGSNLLLLAAPSAIDYYPQIGMNKADNAYLITRSI